jgi:tetratricopeptide (TPR) repeat protein
MTDPSTPSSDLSKALESLLNSNASPEEFARRLFALNFEQARVTDPELAEMMRACAIPRSFDAEIIGVLRDAPDDHTTNEQLLGSLLQFNFIQAREEGGYVYHDNTRDILLADWQDIQNHDQLAQYKDRLATFYRGRGRKYYDEKNFDAALADLSRAIELDPEVDDIYSLRGRTYCRLGQYTEALNDLNRFIKSQPEQEDDYYWRGRAYYGTKDYSMALDDLTRAIELQPENGASYLWRGVIQYALHDYPAGLADLTRAIELQPEIANNYYWRALCFLGISTLLAALQDLEHVIEFGETKLHGLFWRGVTRYLLDRNEDAQSDWNQAATITSTEQKECLRQRVFAKLALLAGRTSSAREHYIQSLQECQISSLRTEIGYLQQLTLLFPDRDDIREMSNWFEAQVQLLDPH